MGTKHQEIFAALARVFEEWEVKTRPAPGGKHLSYITNRTAANRMDECLGPENFKPEYRETRNGLICRIWYRLPGESEWLWKEDGGGSAGMQDGADNEKSAFSDAFKRCCAMGFGVGRYLYRDGFANFGDESESNAHHEPEQRPSGNHSERPNSSPAPQSNGNGYGPPKTGGALFAWSKEQQSKGTSGVVDHINAWGRSQGFPFKMIEWNPEQIAAGHAEGLAFVAGGQSPPTQHREPSRPPANAPAMTGGKDLSTWIVKKEKEQQLPPYFLKNKVMDFGKANGFPHDMWAWDANHATQGLAFAMREAGGYDEQSQDVPEQRQAPAVNHIPEPGPCDPNTDPATKSIKLGLLLSIRQNFMVKNEGRKPTDHEVMKALNDFMSNEGYPEDIPTIRDWKDVAAIEFAGEEFRKVTDRLKQEAMA